MTIGTYVSYPSSGSGSGSITVPTAADLPTGVPDGSTAVTLDTHSFYIYNAGTTTWVLQTASTGITGPGSSVNNQIMLFNGTTGNVAKAATGSGAVFATGSGVYNAGVITVPFLMGESADFTTGGYLFSESGNDTGFTSPGDGIITVYANATTAAEFSQAGISQVRGVPYTWPNGQGAAGTVLQNDGAGNLGWQPMTPAPTGPNNTIAGFDALGDLSNIPDWSWNASATGFLHAANDSGNSNMSFIRDNSTHAAMTGGYSGFELNSALEMSGNYFGFSDNNSISHTTGDIFNFGVGNAWTLVDGNVFGFRAAPEIGTVGGSVAAFTDNTNVTTSTNGYTSYVGRPAVTLTTGNYIGVDISPTIAGNGAVGMDGVKVDMTNATNSSPGGKHALRTDGAPNTFTFSTVAVDLAGLTFGDNYMHELSVPDGVNVTGQTEFGDFHNTRYLLGDAGASMDAGPFGIGNLTHVFAVQPKGVAGSGVMAQVNNIVALIDPDGGSTGGAINEYNAILVTQAPGGTFTVNNSYGVRLKNLGAVATNRWGIYQDDTDANYFAGNVGVGVTTPAEAIDIVGNIQLTTSGYIKQAGGFPIFHTTGPQNTFIGPASGNLSVTGGENAALGWGSMFHVTSGSNNVAMGDESGFSLTTGSNNIFLGRNAGRATVTNIQNVFIGTEAGAVATSDNNIMIGYGAGNALTTGSGRNIEIGFGVGPTNATGTQVILIGAQADVGADGLTNAIAIGDSAVVGASNSMVLGNASVSVGIGTSTPAYKLDVVGSTRFNGDLGVFNTTPVAQQASSGPQTAGAVYTATEQTMLQQVYDALRAYGLLS